MATAALTVLPRRMTLFEHVADVDGILDLVDQLDGQGELTPELTAQLQEALILAVASTKAKVDRCAGVIATFESAEAHASAEADRLTKRAARMKRQREYLETTILAVLEASKIEKLDGDTACLARRRNPPKLIVDDEMLVPFELLRFPEEAPPPDPKPDAAAIKRALKAGTAVPGVHLESSYRLERS
jgi:hypothetical protein